MKRTRYKLRHTIGAIDLCDPFGHLPEHAAVVDFLKRFALDEIVADLPDEQDQRRRVLMCNVNADRGVGRTRAARHERNAGLAGQFRVCLGHEGGAGLVPIDDQLDHLARVVQRVEHRQETFAGHGEGVIDALDQQLIDEQAGAGAEEAWGGSVRLGYEALNAGGSYERTDSRAHCES